MTAKKRSDRLGFYIDLYELMHLERDTHQENRSFGLSHSNLLDSPIDLLDKWREDHLYLLPHPRLSEKIVKLLSRTTLILLVVSFFLGIFSGIGLLRYNGGEPVNLIYFLLAVFLLPLLTMMMSLFAMLRANSAGALLIHISPAYWMENLLLLLPGKSRETFEKLKINPLIANWIVIKHSQEFALAFSLGLFLALLAVVASEDLAFSWSTTLHITAEEFHHLLSMIALPWREWLPQAVPSAELIGQSHYFRLGGKMSNAMIEHASMLGEWWKFLAMTTLFYALFLRFLFFIGASIGLRKAAGRAIVSLEGVRELLREMREPMITTHAPADEYLNEKNEESRVSAAVPRQHYDAVIGWALDKEGISLLNEQAAIESDNIYEAGGLHSLEEDRQVISLAKGEILFYVKAWEPPTMDFIDFVTELSRRSNTSVVVNPVGTPDNGMEATDAEYEIWERKISKLKQENIRMMR